MMIRNTEHKRAPPDGSKLGRAPYVRGRRGPLGRPGVESSEALTVVVDAVLEAVRRSDRSLVVADADVEV